MITAGDRRLTAGKGDPRGWIRVLEVVQSVFHVFLLLSLIALVPRGLAVNKVPMALAASPNSSIHKTPPRLKPLWLARSVPRLECDERKNRASRVPQTRDVQLEHTLPPPSLLFWRNLPCTPCNSRARTRALVCFFWIAGLPRLQDLAAQCRRKKEFVGRSRK